MAKKPAIKNNQTNPQFKKWLDFLSFLNKKSTGKELMNEYFAKEFQKSPESFYEFVKILKKQIPSSKNKKDLASKYLHIISPLCERFGFFHEKKILDDICFKIEDPKNYNRINRIFGDYKEKSQKYIGSIINTLKQVLEKNNFNYEVKGRYKSIHSINKKILNNPQKNILNLKDIFAFRIILTDDIVEECFEVVNLLHDEFSPVADYFKDYISIPKINNYQSLHTGLSNVIPNLDIPIEIQIRTKNMDEFAEKGLAAHWVYNKQKKARLVTEKEKQLFDYLSHIDGTDNVYFFSFSGDMFRLKKGSKIIDFAYRLHSDLGNKNKGALVNNEEKGIDYEISEGDKVEIIKAKNMQVNSNWLKLSNDKYTLKKIHEAIK